MKWLVYSKSLQYFAIDTNIKSSFYTPKTNALLIYTSVRQENKSCAMGIYYKFKSTLSSQFSECYLLVLKHFKIILFKKLLKIHFEKNKKKIKIHFGDFCSGIPMRMGASPVRARRLRSQSACHIPWALV